MTGLLKARCITRFRKWPCMNLQELLNHSFTKAGYPAKGWFECICCGVYSSSTVHGLCPKCEAQKQELGNDAFLDYISGLDYYCRRE